MAQKIRGATVLKNKLHCPLMLLLLCITCLCITRMSHADTLKVCYDQWAPMTIFPTERSSKRGVIIDMLEDIYTSKGYQLEYYQVPLARGLNMVAQGMCDMLPEYLFSKNAEKGFVYASEATFAYSSAFVMKRNDPWRYQGIKSINGKRIATGPGWDYSSMSVDYQRYLDDPKNAHLVEIIAGDDDVVSRILLMIKEGRVDIYADNELVLQHAINKMDLNDELEIIYPGLEKKLLEMPIFSKQLPELKRQELIKIWNEGRLSMKGEKEQMLLKKYKVSLMD